MTFDAFKKSLADEQPPSGISKELEALWWEAKGDWGKAHEMSQEAGTRQGDWVHAYLHRVEGDEGNARYWYARCRKPFFEGSFSDEWDAISAQLLG